MERKFGLDKYTLDAFFRKVVENYAERPAIANYGETPITYRELAVRVKEVQTILAHFGLKKGDHVAICGYSTANWAIAFLAVTTAGMVAIPILEEFPEADINHILHHSEAKALFISKSLLESLDLPQMYHLNLVMVLDDFSILQSSQGEQKGILEKVQHLPRQLLEELGIIKRRNPLLEEPSATIEEDDLAEIVYTSGTTGHSKGVMLTHRNLVSNLFEGPDLLKVITPESVILHFLPLAHTFGSTSGFLSIIYCGSTIYFLGKKPVPKLLLKAMQEVKPTIIGVVPLVFEKIYHKQVLPQIMKNMVYRTLYRYSATRRLLHRMIGKKIYEAFGGRLKCAIIGGAKLSTEVETFLREGGIPFSVGYGLTECSPLVTFSSMENSVPGSVGHAISHVQIRIVNKEPGSNIGEIEVTGPNVMKGYFRNEQLTSEVFTPDHWFKTGDLGYLDEKGYLFITGRKKNVIIGPSGENIYPETIEEHYMANPLVEEVLVYQSGKDIIARIYPDYLLLEEWKENNGKELSMQEIETIFDKIRREINGKLSPFAAVHKVVISDTPFSKTPTNKIRRFEYMK